MHELFTFALFVFTSFLAIINPVGIAPLFVALTNDLSPKLKVKTAIKASITAYFILLIFAFAGQMLFGFFNISAAGFRMAGGVIFLIMGYEMLNARLSKIKYNPEEDEDITEAEATDVAITPLGIPMLAGPGAITNAIVLMDDAQNFESKLVFPLALLAAILVVFFALVSSSKLMKYFGEVGNKVMLKIMGLITMVMGFEFFFAGLKPYVRDILMIMPN
ncbi:MAG: antibiotic resistance protein MarC [Bacteroidetes bacterium]|nr:MAG: antibiotic resistance protein MarC [Bacteroidota bacterium]